jgi:hypothetical protein
LKSEADVAKYLTTNFEQTNGNILAIDANVITETNEQGSKITQHAMRKPAIEMNERNQQSTSEMPCYQGLEVCP